MVVKDQRLERGGATRARLLGAARELFGARGFAATSLDDVVAEADVTKGALYHHFRNKEQLFKAVVEAVKQDTTAVLSDAFLLPDPWEALWAGCQAMLEAFIDPAVRQIVWIDAPAVLDRIEYRELQTRYEPVFFRAVLRRSMRNGLIDPQPLRPLAALLTGALGEAASLVVTAADPAAAREETLGAILRLLAGLRPREAQPPPG